MRKLMAGIAATLMSVTGALGLSSTPSVLEGFSAPTPYSVKNLPTAPDKNKTGEVNLLTGKRRDSSRVAASMNTLSQKGRRKRDRQKRAFM